MTWSYALLKYILHFCVLFTYYIVFKARCKHIRAVTNNNCNIYCGIVFNHGKVCNIQLRSMKGWAKEMHNADRKHCVFA